MLGNQAIFSYNKNMKIKENLSLKKYTTLNIGGVAKRAYFPENKEEVIQVLNIGKIIIIGNGSNILIDDKQEFESVMIMRHFQSIYIEGQKIVCDAGISLKEVCLFAYEHGLTGLEFAYGIPGSVGGAVVMNAGAYGGEMKDVVSSVSAYKQKEYRIEGNQLEFSYRHSCFSDGKSCILEVVLQLEKGNKHDIKAKMEDNMQKRQSKQPLDQHSVGSTFKRGKNFYASALINQCNLKGFSVGGASVSIKHAGFLINHNQATFLEFYTLMQEVMRIVEEKSGKKLEPEVKIIR